MHQRRRVREEGGRNGIRERRRATTSQSLGLALAWPLSRISMRGKAPTATHEKKACKEAGISAMPALATMTCSHARKA